MTSSSGPAGDAAGLRVQVAWCRHRGNFRHENEDTVMVAGVGAPCPAPTDTGACVLNTAGSGFLALVCDGVGGGAAGEVASSLAAREVLGQVGRAGRTAADEREEVLRRAAGSAHQAVLRASIDDPATEGMGTTLTGAWLAGSMLHGVQVGDSRLYRLRRGAIELLSTDQSLVGRLFRAGDITEEQARNHPLRNIVDQVLGGSRTGVEPEVFSVPVIQGDSFLLCSDGLTDALPDRVIARELARLGHRSAAAAVSVLLERVLETSGRDNISIVLLRTGGPVSRLRSWVAAGLRRVGLGR
jgi:protein phosphatase